MATKAGPANWPGQYIPRPIDRSRPATPQERAAALDDYILAAVVRGARIQWRDAESAILVYGKPVNHVLHLLLSVLLLGLWVFVWLFLALTGGETRELVRVNDYGGVDVQRA